MVLAFDDIRLTLDAARIHVRPTRLANLCGEAPRRNRLALLSLGSRDERRDRAQ